MCADSTASPARKNNLPQETGIYWARTSGFTWWNLIIRIEGESPYFSIDAWYYRQEAITSNIPVWEIEEFGPRICDAEAPVLTKKKKKESQ